MATLIIKVVLPEEVKNALSALPAKLNNKIEPAPLTNPAPLEAAG